MGNCKEMYLYEMALEYPTNLKVQIYENGTTIFRGIVGTISRFIDAENLARKVHVYVSELDNLRANVYLQR